jgi:hypothetical protein
VLLQRSGFSGDLTVRETLELWAATLTAPRPVDEMLELLTLEERADVRMRALSGGETRRVDLACTLMGGHELVVLDEPTTGLDPESRRDVWRVLLDLRTEGATILVTTHYLEEAEALADRLEIMHAGRIVRSGTPAEIAAGHPSTISFAERDDVPDDLAGVRHVRHERGRTTLETAALQRSLSDLLAWASHNDVDLVDLDARSPSLEAVVPRDRRRPRRRADVLEGAFDDPVPAPRPAAEPVERGPPLAQPLTLFYAAISAAAARPAGGRRARLETDGANAINTVFLTIVLFPSTTTSSRRSSTARRAGAQAHADRRDARRRAQSRASRCRASSSRSARRGSSVPIASALGTRLPVNPCSTRWLVVGRRSCSPRWPTGPRRGRAAPNPPS